MQNNTFSLYTNIAYIDYKGVRLWVNALLIEDKIERTDSLLDNRQLRGLGFYPVHVFTIWLDPQADIEFYRYDQGRLKMISHDGSILSLEADLVLKTKDRDGREIVLRIAPSDLRNRELKAIKDLTYPISQDVLDSSIEKFWQAPNRPYIQYGPVNR